MGYRHTVAVPRQDVVAPNTVRSRTIDVGAYTDVGIFWNLTAAGGTGTISVFGSPLPFDAPELVDQDPLVNLRWTNLTQAGLAIPSPDGVSTSNYGSLGSNLALGVLGHNVAQSIFMQYDATVNTTGIIIQLGLR